MTSGITIRGLTWSIVVTAVANLLAGAWLASSAYTRLSTLETTVASMQTESKETQRLLIRLDERMAILTDAIKKDSTR